MSLHIELIGYRKDRRTYDAINSINNSLKEIGIDYQFYSKNLPDDIILPGVSLRTSDLNCLKNVFLELKSNPDWTTESDSLFIGEDRYFFFDLAKEIFGGQKSHFVWHYNFGGCYVPVDFQDLPVSDDFLRNLGSSINLRNELEEIANKLKLDLGDYTPDFELLYEQRIYELQNDLLGFEKMLLLYLYNIVLASIRYNLIIQYS